MRHSSQHDHAGRLEAERDQLLTETHDYLASGVVRDLAHALAVDQGDHSPTIKVQVPRDSANALAASLSQIIPNPLSVHVTDMTGKQIEIHAGVTYEDLAEMVCSKGYRLHVVPPIEAAAFAADIASSTDGSMLIPGRKPIVQKDLAEYLAAAIEEGDQERLGVISKLLRKCGDGMMSPPSKAFADLSEGRDVPLDADHYPDSERFGALIVGWARFRTASSPEAFADSEGPIADASRVVEISAAPPTRTRVFSGGSRMVEICADETAATAITATADGVDNEVAGDAAYQTYRAAKLRHAKAAMAAMSEDASEEDHQTYATACAELSQIDQDSCVSNGLTNEQHEDLVRAMGELSRAQLASVNSAAYQLVAECSPEEARAYPVVAECSPLDSHIPTHYSVRQLGNDRFIITRNQQLAHNEIVVRSVEPGLFQSMEEARQEAQRVTRDWNEAAREDREDALDALADEQRQESQGGYLRQESQEDYLAPGTDIRDILGK